MSIPQVLFISDFHIGEKLGSVTDSPEPHYVKLNNNYYVREEFNEYLLSLKENYQINENNKIKYLVIMGDQWDLAVQPMPYSFNLSLDFFNGTDLQNYIEEIIYIPGNHDHHIWRMYQSRYCVTEQLEHNEQAVTEYPQVITGYLDLTGSQPRLDVQKINGYDAHRSFVTGLTGRSTIPVNIVYPNLYIIYNGENNQKKAVICTHGHLFDAPWNLVTDAIFWVTRKTTGKGQRFDLHDIEMLNSPVTEFWNYSISQVGKYNVVDDIYDLYLLLQSLLTGWLKTLFQLEGKKKSHLLPEGKGKQENRFLLPRELTGKTEKDIEDLFTEGVKAVMDDVKSSLALIRDKSVPAVKESKFLEKNQQLVVHYLDESVKDLAKYGISEFTKIIYGHTHQPEKGTIFRPDNTDINLIVYNTGGWVNIDKKDYPELFLMFETGEVKELMKA